MAPRRNIHSQSNSRSRAITVSKALSRLLRHQAENEKIPISPEGWVQLDHVLAWKGLRGRVGVDTPVTVDEIWDVVEDNEKKRFAVKLFRDQDGQGLSKRVDEADLADSGAAANVDESQDGTPPAEAAADSETAKAISAWRAGTDTTVSHYSIRAVQGHSIKAVTNEEALSPITLEDPTSIPETVVHGTFYASWPLILQSGGLKRMGRNCVHFATGPAIEEVLPPQGRDADGERPEIAEVLEKNQVISGMRRDAQILIYVDVKACLEDVKARGVDMLWYRSENGVILTEGLVHEQETTMASEPLVSDEQGPEVRIESQRKAAWKKGKYREPEKMVPMQYVTKVVEYKQGLGVIWTKADGEVQQLPERLLRMGTPKGKGTGRGGRGAYRGRGRGSSMMIP